MIDKIIYLIQKLNGIEESDLIILVGEQSLDLKQQY